MKSPEKSEQTLGKKKDISKMKSGLVKKVLAKKGALPPVGAHETDADKKKLKSFQEMKVVTTDLNLEGMKVPREQLRQLLFVSRSVRGGDFNVRMPVAEEGIVSEIGEVLNDIIELNEAMAKEIVRVRNIVGLEGKMTERVSIGNIKGSWAVSVDSLNALIGDLVQPTTEAARVITSVAKGDLSQKNVYGN